MLELINSFPLWKYIGVTLAFAIVLASCNWLLIRLTFYPANFIGLFNRIGWQGLAHRHVEKISRALTRNFILNQVSLHQLFELIEPEMLVNQIERIHRPHLDQYIDEVMEMENSIIWENLPIIVKNRIYSHCHRQFRKVIDNIVDDLGKEITYLFDLDQLVINSFKEDPALLNQLFFDAGHQIYRLLVRSAIPTAMILGCIPALFMYYTPNTWILPVLGLLIGSTTNAVLVKLIHGSKGEYKPGPIELPGALYQFRHQINNVLSEFLSNKILTTPNIIYHTFHGPKHKRTRQLVRKHLQPIIDNMAIKTLSQLTTGPSGFVDLKNTATEKTINIFSLPFEDDEFNKNRALEVNAHFNNKLDQLGNHQSLIGLIDPLISQSKGKLIFCGGVSGGITGLLLFHFCFAPLQ